MSRIAILHPQCRIQGGAIKMALLSTRLLAEAGHDTTLYTFAHSPECFSDLQKNLEIVTWAPKKKEEIKKNKEGIFKKTGSFLLDMPFRHFSSLLFIISSKFSPLKKLTGIITLAWRLRQVDTIIANNPPMQVVAALAKVFNRKIHTLWWHHHTPWYMSHRDKKEEIKKNKEGIFKQATSFLFSFFSFLGWKSIFERIFVIPFIDTMIVTSHFVGEQLKAYSGRDATVIHPVLDKTSQPFNKKNISDNDKSRILLFTHGRLEPGKGIETIISVWKTLESDTHTQGKTKLVIYGTGSLEKSLKDQGIDVQPYDTESTLRDIENNSMSSLAIYASTIDAFGMASLEAQATGISTLILDRGGARETLVSDVSGECVGRLVDTESGLCATAGYFITHKKFPENMSIVNFSHTIDYFTQRLSSDLLSVINKTRE